MVAVVVRDYRHVAAPGGRGLVCVSRTALKRGRGPLLLLLSQSGRARVGGHGADLQRLCDLSAIADYPNTPATHRPGVRRGQGGGAGAGALQDGAPRSAHWSF